MAGNAAPIGVLALQGAFELHLNRLRELKRPGLEVRTPAELEQVGGLIIPGGESTTLLKLLDEKLKNLISRRVEQGMPVFGTCAGLILLARKVDNPIQESLNLLDVDVCRNAYGRQVDSFVTPNLQWTKQGAEELEKFSRLAEHAPTNKSSSTHNTPRLDFSAPVEGVFIRAPRITALGPLAISLLEHEGEPVFVKQRERNIFGGTFHPELSTSGAIVHRIFAAAVDKAV